MPRARTFDQFTAIMVLVVTATLAVVSLAAPRVQAQTYDLPDPAQHAPYVASLAKQQGQQPRAALARRKPVSRAQNRGLGTAASVAKKTWRMLVLIYPHSDFPYVDGNGQSQRFTGSLNPSQISLFRNAATNFADLVPEWSASQAFIDLDVREVARPLTALQSVNGGREVWPSPTAATPEIEAAFAQRPYDSVMVLWHGGPSLRAGFGLAYTVPISFGGRPITYGTVVFGEDGYWQGRYPGEVMVHEWLHGVEGSYHELGYVMSGVDSGGSRGYERDNDGSWKTFLSDLMRGKVVEQGSSYSGISWGVWQAGTLIQRSPPWPCQGLAPLNDQFTSTRPTLRWAPVRADEYYVAVYRRGDTSAPAASAVTTSPNWTVPAGKLQPGVSYSWYVWSNIGGVYSEQGDELHFTTTGQPAGEGTGIAATYFATPQLSGNSFTRIDQGVGFNWLDGSPGGGIGPDNFSVRWTGQVEAPFSERYTFYTTTDDGVRLWVDGQLLIDWWSGDGLREASGSITLQAGRRYELKMEYYENTGGAMAHLLWTSASTPKEIVPGSRLYPPPTPTLTVSSPNGGEILTAGASSTIVWSSSNLAATVKLEFSEDDGATWTTIAASTPNDGSHLWTVPNRATSRGRIRVSSTIDAAVNDMSDGSFVIDLPATLQVTAPNGGERWTIGASAHVTWSSSSAGSTVRIEISRGGGPWTSIAENVANTGSYQWTVSGPTTTQARIRVTAREVEATADTSDADFAIVSVAGNGTGLVGVYYAALNLTRPQFARVDSQVNFPWDGGSPGGGLAADYFSVRWMGHVQALHDEEYTFVTETDDGVRLWVDGRLLIDKWVDQPTTRWSGRIALRAGQKYEIRMEYYERTGGAFAALLWSSPSTPEAAIPQSQLYAGNLPQIPRITVQSPNGGEQWPVASTQNISWSSSHAGETVRIDISRDGGTQWTSLVGSTPNDGHYSWQVSPAIAANVIVRVSSMEITDCWDQSDRPLAIVEPLPRLYSFTITPARIRGGKQATATLWLSDRAPTGGAWISLTNSRSDVATVPSSVLIRGGRKSATFKIPTKRPRRSVNVEVGASSAYGTHQAVFTVRP